MKIYTKTGDRGETGLFGGERVPKNHPRVHAYGEVDELNAVLGMAQAQRPVSAVAEELARIQAELFTVGADLATPTSIHVRTPRVSPEQIARLEACIDRFSEELPPLTRFVLPGGNPSGAALHLARCVCRRAERAVLILAQESSARAEELTHVLIYLNRLADLLFVLARAANYGDPQGDAEVFWDPPAS